MNETGFRLTFYNDIEEVPFLVSNKIESEYGTTFWVTLIAFILIFVLGVITYYYLKRYRNRIVFSRKKQKDPMDKLLMDLTTENY